MFYLKFIQRIAVVFICLSCFGSLRAQETASLQIRITDQNSALIERVTVRLKNGREQTIKELTGDKAQPIIFSGVSEGDYVLEIESPGFKAAAQKISVRSGKNLLDIKLEIEEIKTDVDVKQSEREKLLDEAFNTDFTEEQIKALPDDPDEIRKELQRRYGDDVVIRVDGFEGGRIPPKEQIASIKVVKSSFDAEFHEIGQTVVDIQTKAGGKLFVGSLYSTYGNSLFSARNAFARERLPAQNASLLGFFIFPAIKKKTNLMFDFFAIKSYRANAIVAQLPDGKTNDSVKSGYDNFQPALRLVHNISKIHTLSAAYNFETAKYSNFGVGGLNLPERAYSNKTTSHNLRVSEYGTIRKKANQFRLELSSAETESKSVSGAPGITVLGAFARGGAGIDNRSRRQEFSLADNLFFDYGKHAFKIGVAFEYERDKLASADNLNGRFVFLNSQDFQDNKPYSFTQRRQKTSVSLAQFQIAGFVQDDFRVSRNFQISAGLRYERQNNLKDDNNFSPRLSFTWSPSDTGKLVVRSGVGVFYQWFETNNLSVVLSNDGRAASDLIILNPGYPNPFASGTVGNPLAPSIIKRDERLTNPHVFISKTALSYRWNKNLKMETFYTYRRGAHQFRSRDINAPVNGLRADPLFGRIVQVESSGNSVENSLELKFAGSIKKGITFDANYKLAKINSDFEDVFGLPTDSFDTRRDWAASNLDQRHRLSASVNFSVWKKIAFNGIFRLDSPRPFNLTTGRDDNGDTVTNDRPEGVERNSLRGVWSKLFDVNLSRQLKVKKESGNRNSMFNFLGQKLSVTLSIQNLFNQTNRQGFVGNRLSPFFLRATSAAPARTVQFRMAYSF
jgi:HSP20 family molecular chaperone IbpA